MASRARRLRAANIRGQLWEAAEATNVFQRRLEVVEYMLREVHFACVGQYSNVSGYKYCGDAGMEQHQGAYQVPPNPWTGRGEINSYLAEDIGESMDASVRDDLAPMPDKSVGPVPLTRARDQHDGVPDSPWGLGDDGSSVVHPGLREEMRAQDVVPGRCESSHEDEEELETTSSPWLFLCPIECAKLSMCRKGHRRKVMRCTPLREWNEEYDNDVRAINAEFEGEDVEEQWEDQELSAEEFEEFYQMAMSTSPENPEQAFSEILEHARRREEYGWP